LAANGTELKIKRTDRTFRHCEIVPEWGGPVYLRLLTAAEHLSLSFQADAGEYFVEVLCRCICKEDGKPAPEIVQAIREADAAERHVVTRLAEIAAKINGLLKSSKEDAKKKSPTEK
jgi:hypothetical protein